ncbi:hypothetical protein QUV83_09815 [Cellulomonas cellasea]|uniref:hypothetical protein n=1 Tax=Cellulomonas cellasea TaxID=43670 RepID=UPI0025A411E2|nr:hypothetical protein [Cellulomonas cellasea]MDM8085059.1 hypothetical protein [Cellulomonas cellasea]
MSARPYSWFPLATADPVPGDPDAVERDAAQYRAVATNITEAAKKLDDIADSPDMLSDAVAAVRTRARDVADEVGKAQSRYEAVATALSTYAAALKRAQAEADSLLERARTAQNAIDSATTERTIAARVWGSLDEDTTAEERRLAGRRLTQARTAVNDGESALQRLRDDLDVVVRDRDVAAQRAAEGIGRAVAHDALSDGWWEDWGVEALKSISSIAGTVAAVAGLLSLFLGWVPLLGQALAAVAIIAGVAALFSDVVLAATGEQGWENVAIGAIGIATFGAGRALAATAKAFSGSARAAARSAIKISQRSGNPAIAATAVSARPAVLARSSVKLTFRDLMSAGRAAPQLYQSAFRAARAQVASASGAHRWLAMAGHGDLAADIAALDIMRRSLVRPQAVDRLNVTIESGRLLMVGGAVVYGVDRVDTTANLGRSTIDIVEPAATGAERLKL